MAGLIPQSFIDDLLDRLDIVEVIDRRVSLKKSGKNYTACCPFHDEKTPSFSVNQEKQFYYCFGCGAGGNALGFLMDYERMEFPRAVEALADAAGLEVPKEALAFREQPQTKKNIYTILEKAAAFYSDQLKQHPQKQVAVDYLKKRGLSGEIARDFDIGYAPPGWDNLLKHLGQNEEDRQLLIDGGMLIEKEEENKLYDRFRDRIIFPIRDNRGRIIAFGGRVLGDDKPKYLNSPETPVFHKSKELYGLYQSRKSNRQLQRLLIVEGYMDVVALAQHGINWAAATLGTATSTDHLTRVFRQCPEVVFCFDGDDAGRKAAVRALESALPAMEDGRQAKFLFLPQGEDPDSMVRDVGANNFIRLIDKAEPLEQYLFNAQAEGLDLNSLDGRARLTTMAAPLINKLPNGVFKELMWESLAERTGLSRNKLSEILSQHQANHADQQPDNRKSREKNSNNYPDAPPEYYQDDSAAPDNPSIRPVKNPKQRPALETVLEPHSDKALYAIGILTLFPNLGSRLDGRQLPNPEQENRLTLLNELLALVYKRPDSSTHMILGHWLEAPWKGLIEQGLSAASLFDSNMVAETDPETELSETVSYLSKQFKQADLTLQVDKLAAEGYGQLSKEKLQQLNQLIKQKHEL